MAFDLIIPSMWGCKCRHKAWKYRLVFTTVFAWDNTNFIDRSHITDFNQRGWPLLSLHVVLTHVIRCKKSRKLITINKEPGTLTKLNNNMVFSRLLRIKPAKRRNYLQLILIYCNTECTIIHLQCYKHCIYRMTVIKMVSGISYDSN